MQRPRSSPRLPGKSVSASALVVVLAVTVILALIVISLAVTMRLERQSAHYFSERSRASLMADEGSEVARMMLSDAFGKTQSSTNKASILTSPGRIFLREAGGTNWQPIELSSGLGTNGATGVFAPADVNRAIRTRNNEKLVDPLGAEMPLKWVYVYKDGSRQVTDQTPSLNATNTLIGRYAFWVDDESTKVNLNTARRRLTTGEIPDQVDITALATNLGTTDADAIFAATKIRPLQSLPEIERIDSGYAAAFSTNRFSATHYNRSSNLNPWGEPKIVLTTRRENLSPDIRAKIEETKAAGGDAEEYKYYLDIYKDNATNPERTDAIDYTKLTKLLLHLNSYLERTDWPFMPPGASSGDPNSFQKKFKGYGAAADRRVTQLGLDIIQYVRCAESTSPLVASIRGRWTGNDFVTASTNADLFYAGGRGPMITEMACWVSPQPAAGQSYYTMQLRFEMYLPPHYGLGSVDLANMYLTVQAAGRTVLGLSADKIQASWISPAVLNAGSYAVITTPVVPLLVKNTTTNADEPLTDFSRFGIRIVINDETNKIAVDQATSGSKLSVEPPGIPYPLTPPTRPAALTDVPSLDNVSSVEVDDPRSNQNATSWKLRAGGNSFGLANSIWKQTTPSSDGLPHDLDGTVYSDYSLSRPAPAGSANNPTGRVASVAELGRIPTGIETSAAYRQHAAPWRTLRLQPTASADRALPDWALLELFAAPVKPQTGTEKIYFTSPDLMGGQVNINTAVAPYSGREKSGVIAALLGDASHPALDNILERTRAANGRTFSNDGSYYVSVGELSEIRGVSDAGEASESNLRQVASQATTTGATFRVFSIGQALTQSGNNVMVSATRTTETLMEFQPETGADPVTFRTLSWEPHSF